MYNQSKDSGVSSTQSRVKKIIIALSICMTMLFSMRSTEALQGKSYTPTVKIVFKDGKSSSKEYLVKQDTVENVLDELNVELSSKDKINTNASKIVEENDYIQVTRVTTKTVKQISYTNYKTVNKGKKKWGSTVVQNGKKGQVQKTYTVTYENGKQVSKKLTSSKVISKPVNKIVKHDVIATGTTFTGRLTTYGGDCKGCSGLSASGVKLSSKTGVNNSKSPYLTYKGEKYYCIAADKSIPFGTIIEITNHNLNLPKTIKAIVVDRGGAIKGKTIDIFNGSEKGKKYFKSNSTNKAQFKIIKLGSGKAKFWK